MNDHKNIIESLDEMIRISEKRHWYTPNLLKPLNIYLRTVREIIKDIIKKESEEENKK